MKDSYYNNLYCGLFTNIFSAFMQQHDVAYKALRVVVLSLPPDKS